MTPVKLPVEEQPKQRLKVEEKRGEKRSVEDVAFPDNEEEMGGCGWRSDYVSLCAEVACCQV